MDKKNMNPNHFMPLSGNLKTKRSWIEYLTFYLHYDRQRITLNPVTPTGACKHEIA